MPHKTERPPGRRIGRALAITVGLMLAIEATTTAPPASAKPGNLAGTWTSVDLDGSNQTLRIRGAGNPVYAMFLTDDFTSGACGGRPAKLVGSGAVHGPELQMRGTLVCLPGGNPLRGRISVGFVYDAETDTLTDDFGVVWERAA